MEFDGSNLGMVRSVSGKLLRLPSSDDMRVRARGTSSSEDEHEPEVLECRVCRGEPEAGRRLYAPCLCSGSIMYIHEDCLQQWLAHSKKDRCDRLRDRFTYVPNRDTFEAAMPMPAATAAASARSRHPLAFAGVSACQHGSV